MFMTAREKAIVELIIKKNGRHSIASIADYLHVSTRTIQRDLKSIEKTLIPFELTIENDNGLSIVGTNQNIYRLIQELIKFNPIDLSLEERRLLAYIKLLDSDGPIKLAPLAKEMGVSITTLGTDLDDLTDWLKKYEIILDRKKGVGVEIIGREKEKRKALVSYLLIYFHNELIDNLFLLSSDQIPSDRILFCLKKEYLKVIDKVVYQYINRIELKLADSDYIAFIIHICIALQRIEKGYHLSERIQDIELIKNSEEYSILTHIQNDLYEKLSIKMNDYELYFLVSVLKGSKIVEPENTYYDRVFISRSVKKMILDVSGQLNVDLSVDFSLFQGLMAHMEPTIYRLSKGLTYFNPLTEEIKQMYPLLFMAVNSSVNKIFAHYSFSEDEIAYIVLHFGSALELKKEDVEIHALIVCPTGIGTSKMLASRIKNEVPEITSSDIISLKEIHTIDWSKYQIIISTILLPIQGKFDYVHVNPLLYEKDIETIHSYLSTHIQQITKQNIYSAQMNGSESKRAHNSKMSLYSFMDEIDLSQKSIRTLLQNFSVARMQNEPTYDLLIKKMVENEAEKGIVMNVDDVFQQLKSREAKGGLGIPQTNMALFHCRHDQVKEMTFRIAHLEDPYTLLGMDGNKMDVRNILLLLAPETLSELELEILSMVSAIIVENKKTIMIFSSANEKLIRSKLEESFLNFLHNKFEKE